MFLSSAHGRHIDVLIPAVAAMQSYVLRVATSPATAAAAAATAAVPRRSAADVV